MTALTHAAAQTVRHPRSTSASIARSALAAARSLPERRAASRYRNAYGAASYTAEETAALLADTSGPVRERPTRRNA